MRTRNTFLLSLPLFLVLGACQGGINIEGGIPDDTTQRSGTSFDRDEGLLVETTDDRLVISSALINLENLEVEGRTESSEFDAGAQTLDLGLDGSATPIGIADVPAGTYQEIALELDSVQPAIEVSGTFNREPFSYESDFAAELEFDLGNLEVHDGELATVEITFDVASWFLDASGGALDPRLEANRVTIEANIARSVDAHIEYEDDDDDGDDD